MGKDKGFNLQPITDSIEQLKERARDIFPKAERENKQKSLCWKIRCSKVKIRNKSIQIAG